MFTTLTNLMRGAAADAEEALIDANALRLAEQKLRDATAAHEGGKRALSQMILEQRGLEKQLSQIASTLAQTEQKAVTALNAGREDLATLAAGQIETDERRKQALSDQLDQLSVRIAKLKSKLASGDSKLLSLRQGVHLAKAQERDRGVTLSLSKKLTSASAIKEADALLARANSRTDQSELLEIYEEVDNGLSVGGNSSLDEALDAAGLGDGPKSRAADILARLKTQASSKCTDSALK